MSTPPEDFDPESRAEREIAGEAAGDRSDFLSLMGHAYRGELDRTTTWRSRLDRTTNWAVVLTATLLTWAFSAEGRPHYVLLVGMVMVGVFLGIEARRYRTYDVWRSRVRLLEENVLANALDPEGAEQSNWRELLSEDFREPTIKTPALEAVSRRLRRVYLPLLAVLVVAWVVRLVVFSPSAVGALDAAAVGVLPGVVTVACVLAGFAASMGLALIPTRRRAKGALQEAEDAEEWQ